MEILRAKLFPQHGAQLMRDQILRMDKEWNVLPESDKTSVPHYFFWLMNPDNEAAAQMQHRLLIKEATTKQEETYNNVLNELSSERDDVFDNEQDWFKRELHDLDKQKECLDEYFYYFKKHTTKSMLKVHDNVHERWSQFSLRPNTEEATPVGNSDILLVDGQPKVSNRQLPIKERTHFIISLKVLDVEYHSTNPSKPPKYNSVGHVAFSTKEQFIDGKSYKVGLAGSGWCAPIYRTQCPSMKFSAWYMKILIMLCLNIRYCYAHVFAENSKSFGFIAKSGMAATRFQLKFLGFNMELKKSELISVRHENIVSQTQIVQSEVEPAQSSLRSVNSLEEYKILMGKIYGKSNFLITHLENLYYHPNFAGCYVDEQSQVSFQVWKCKYALDNQTQQQMPSYMVFNITHLSQCDIPLIDQQCDHLLSNLKQVILPQLVKNSSFPSANIATLAFATHGGSIYQYLLRNYAHLESISFASLFYTFQDNFKLIGKKSQELDPVTKFLCQPGNAGEEKNLFLDMRDCTGKPMVWSDEIKETEMATILPQVSDAVFTYSGNARSSVERVASIPAATTITSSSSRMYASKL